MNNFSLKIVGALIAAIMLVPAVAAEPPMNDNRADAALLLLMAEADTREATTEAGERLSTCTSVGKTVWYTVVVVAPIVIDTEGSNFDTTLAAFDGDDMVACNDDGGSGLLSRMVLDTPGVYSVQLGGYNGWFGAAAGDAVVNVNLA